MFKGSFPPKQLAGNLSPAVIELRRSALEHYLLKIINRSTDDVIGLNYKNRTVLYYLIFHNNLIYPIVKCYQLLLRKGSGPKILKTYFRDIG